MRQTDSPYLTAQTERTLLPGPTRRLVPCREVRGLYLKIEPTGRKVYQLRFSHRGKRTDETLIEAGRRPLTEVRDLARRRIRQIQDCDPRLGDGPASLTVQEVVSALRASPEFQNLQPTTQMHYNTYINRRLLPAVGDRPVTQVTKGELRDLFREALSAGTGVYRGTRAATIRVFRHAVDADLISVNPASLISHMAKPMARERPLTEPDIAAFWKVTGQGDGKVAELGLILRLCLLTGARRCEVAGMRMEELRLEAGYWVVPKERNKSGDRAYQFPIPEKAGQLLLQWITDKKIERGALFSVHPHSPTRAMHRLTQTSDFTTRFSPHDLRHTMITTMTRDLAVPPHVVARVINHSAPRGALKFYDHHSYFPERSAAVSKWAAHVASIVGS